MAPEAVAQAERRPRLAIWLALALSILLSSAALALWTWNFVASRSAKAPSPPSERVIDAPAPDNLVKSGVGTSRKVEKGAPGPDNTATRLPSSPRDK